MTTMVSTHAVARSLGRVIAQVNDGTRVVLSRYGKPVAAVVPIAEFLHLLERQRRRDRRRQQEAPR